ncbi:MAG TPA: hypothetical protein VKG44_04905, partial [Candidatus Baltobacteraceae bacterium]|nr:hypothetical protein [Candidatus Baltobacteraceae bacterium]
MDESFVPLAVWLRAPLAPAAPAEVRPQSNAGEGEDAAGGSDLIADLTLLRLAALEAFERARGRLLERLARDVLGRELMLAPADLQTLAERALEAFAESEPLTLAIAPADA